MIVISQSQLKYFANQRKDRFEERMCAYLRDQFPDELWPVSQQELRRHVATALAGAHGAGLYSELDCCRYLNLALVYGWDFERREEYAWMRAMLHDEAVGDPGRRLQRLVDECLHREAAGQRRRLGAPIIEEDELLMPNKDHIAPCQPPTN